MDRPEDLFEKWYVQPLERLREIPNGAGGFVALATCCFLYERYAVAVIEKSGHNADTSAIISQFATDFGVDKETAQNFWDVIRNGLLHGGMPKQQEYGQQTLPYWAMREDFPAVELSEWCGKRILKVQPWQIMEKVISLWRENLHLLDRSKSFPWANILPLPF
ncbi:MAG: hypothetical protein H5T64_03505 [Chloroflexi bacterium]|nr:hypothetical protein [Chloroflexota bacterium]